MMLKYAIQNIIILLMLGVPVLTNAQLQLVQELDFEDEIEKLVLDKNNEILFVTFSNELNTEPYSYGNIVHYESGIIFIKDSKKILLRKDEYILCANPNTLITRHNDFINGGYRINQYAIQDQELILLKTIDFPHIEFVVSPLDFSEGPILVFETSEGGGGGGEMIFYSNQLDEIYTYQPFEEGFEDYSIDYLQNQLLIAAKSIKFDSTKFLLYDLERGKVIADTILELEDRMIRLLKLIKKDTVFQSIFSHKTGGENILLNNNLDEVWNLKNEGSAYEALLHGKHLILQIRDSTYIIELNSGKNLKKFDLLNEIEGVSKVVAERNISARCNIYSLSSDCLGVTIEIRNEPEQVTLSSFLVMLNEEFIPTVTNLNNQLPKDLKCSSDNEIWVVTSKKIIQYEY